MNWINHTNMIGRVFKIKFTLFIPLWENSKLTCPLILRDINTYIHIYILDLFMFPFRAGI